MKKKLVIFSGAGLDKESGISTFRDSDGMWNNYKIGAVATHDAWINNRHELLQFYNERHKELQNVKPNKAHKILAKLEKDFDVYHITQNVSDLLEKAGCTNILHLHGELTKIRSCGDDNTIYDWPDDLELKTYSFAPDGFALRPHIVLFNEDVPNRFIAYDIVEEADIFVIIGTTLNVYPAAGLIDYVKEDVPIFIINPEDTYYDGWKEIKHIKDVATTGVDKLRKILKKY